MNSHFRGITLSIIVAGLLMIGELVGISGLAGIKQSFAVPTIYAQSYYQLTLQPGSIVKLGSYSFVQLDSIGTLMALESVFLCPLGSYVDNGTCQLCSTGLNNCTACASPTACHTCATGYHLENFSCIPDCDEVTNCNSCDSPNHCAPTGCSTGYYPNTTTGQCDTCSSLDSNCLTCDGTTTSSSATCNSCTTGYYPNGSSCSSCSDTLSHCTSCSNSSTCLTCEVGYHLDPTTATCIPDCSVTNCNTCSSPNYCSSDPGSCDTGYYSDSGGCLDCATAITGCSECSDGNTCTTCRPGYTLEANGTCTPTGSVPDCSVYSDPDICSSCNSGYYLDTNACLNCNTNISNCATCNYASTSATLTCDSCTSGYSLDSSTNTCTMDCNPTGGNCNTCTTPNYCAPTGCNSGYFNTGGTCAACSTTLSHCTSCSDGTTCNTCETGYHVDPATNTCVLDCNPAGGNCNTCDSPDHCSPTGCAPGYTTDPTTGTCEMNCSVPNCLNSTSCTAPDFCSTCTPGYYPNLTNGQCNACSVMTGCAQCSDGSTCNTCETGYILEANGTCTPTGSISNCTTYSTPGQCSTCDSGYTLNLGTNSCEMNCNPIGGNCNTCDSPDHCGPTGCDAGYYNDNGTCSSCLVMTGCTSCADSSTCTTCETGYNLVSGVCVPTGTDPNCNVYVSPDVCAPTGCSGGYYNNSGTCTSCTTGCSDCSDGSSCNTCTTGYYLTGSGPGSSCTACSTVSTGCTACSDASTCTTCATGYNLVAGECIPTGDIDNCTAYSAPDQCSTCDTGYYLNTNACPACSDTLTANCLTCTSAGHCTSCTTGTILTAGNCASCSTAVTNCNACDGTSCTGCASGYYLDGGTCPLCSAAIIGCNECSNSSTCTSCQPGYILEANGTCTPTGSIPDCTTYSTPGQCSACATGYTLNTTTNSCDMNCNPLGGNCNTCDTPDHCSPTGCVSGYFSNNGTCTTCASTIPGCTTCSSGATCTTCDTTAGYVLDGATCRAIPPAPTNLTIPATIYNAQTITITWDPSTNATGYILERSCNSSEWNSIYQGASPSATNNLADCEQPVQYRVKAFNTLVTIASDYTASSPQNYAPCITNCDACTDSSTCTTCIAGYNLVNGKCELDCTDPASIIGTMQTFTVANCNSYATPSATNYTPIGCLTDGRDNKVYEVRKFADGNCWMVDNLRYGGDTVAGGTDECANKTTFNAAGSATPTNTFGTGTYGDCRDPAQGVVSTSPCYNSTSCGYYYNWQAAVQSASAYFFNDHQPSEPAQGICPSGWHLSTGGLNGEFTTLDQSTGGSGGDFFRPGHSFKSVYAGSAFDGGAVIDQGINTYWWSSTQQNSENSYSSDIRLGGFNLANPNFKDFGFSVRCLKNTIECSANCASCTSATSCNQCSDGYVLDGGACIPTGTVPNCVTYSTPNVCSACESGYSLDNGQCVMYCSNPANIVGTMQTFTVANCNSYATPSATNYTPIGCLTDERDNKVYEVRKFADGNCWMVDNLRYGGDTVAGGTDECANKTTFDGCGNGSGVFDCGGGSGASKHDSVWGYGDCRSNPGYVGYLYNWQAAMQQATAYYNTNYTGPTTNVQGICPTGWHLPSGDTTGEFAALDIANGGSGANRSCSDAPCVFFQPGGNFKSAYAGLSDSNGLLELQGDRVYWWSSTPEKNGYYGSYNLDVDPGNLYPNYGSTKNYGFSVRCIKNTVDCSTNCISCNTPTTCNQCADGYVLDSGVCIPTGTDPNCTTYSAPDVCSTCENGYSLDNGQCITYCSNPANIVGTMQTFTEADCDAYATPSQTNYTPIGCLTDERDNKVYEVRKFADGNCWMVDNLRYGGDTVAGGTDECANKTTFDGCGDNGACSSGASKTGMAWGFGDCRSNPGTNHGYLYNYQAAVQSASAYYGNSHQPSQPTQGICPTGWHLPSGNIGGEFVALDLANSGTGANRSSCTTDACNFWRPGGNFKSVYVGLSESDGALNDQGNGAYWWSSTNSDGGYSYYLGANFSSIYPADYNFKDYGFSVRCIKDATPPTMQSFTADDCAAYPTPAGTDYTPIGELVDERDGKLYEVRKFADGNCWMVDNLAYGGDTTSGGTDECASKTTFAGDANLSGAAWGYGDCRSNPGTNYGYLYNWQAAMQHASAYYNTNYTGPTTNVQGICPTGWHLPSGSTGGEFSLLDQANGGTGAYRSCSDAPCTFFRPGGNFKGVYAGNSLNDGTLGSQGSYAYWWSGTQYNSYYSYYLVVHSSYLAPGDSSSKGSGFSVRCLKDQCNPGLYYDGSTCTECATAMPGCTACSNGSVCSACGAGYVLEDGVCLSAPAAPTNLTIPTTIYNAQTITISWNPSVNATGYILERSCNSGVWSQIHHGATPSATNNLTDCEGPVQYRVKAYNTVITIASDYTISALRDYEACNGCAKCSDTNTCICTNNTTPIYTGLTMQEFTPAQCAAVTTPEGTCYSAVGTFTDARDGKAYEIRKFADGKCWMVDNLAYGGATDACANKTTYNGSGTGTTSSGANKTGSAWGYGDCRNNPGSSTYGYLYNWQATMQHASAYYNTNYTGPTTNVQGICPTGWHVPTGGASGEYRALHVAAGSPVTGFWQAGESWKVAFSGSCDNIGNMLDQSGAMYAWSSTQGYAGGSYFLLIGGNNLWPATNIVNKYHGYAVRCIKN